MPRSALAAAIAVTALLALPSAGFGAVTIGSDLTQTPNGNICVAGFACTYFTVNATGPLPQTVPFDGVIVRWRVKAGSSSGTVALRVIKSGSPFQATGDGTSDSHSGTSGLSTYPSRVPIKAGEGVGLDNESSLLLFGTAVSGPTTYAWTPPLADGGALRSPDQTRMAYELLVNADVEPDADHDGFGDETQDQCPTNASTQGPCPPGTTGTSGAVADTTAPGAGLLFRSRYELLRTLRRGIRGKVVSSEAGDVTATATIARSTWRRLGSAAAVTVAKGSATFSASGTVPLTLRFTRKAKARLKKASSVRLRLSFKVRDKARNTTTLTKRVTLKRRR